MSVESEREQMIGFRTVKIRPGQKTAFSGFSCREHTEVSLEATINDDRHNRKIRWKKYRNKLESVPEMKNEDSYNQFY